MELVVHLTQALASDMSIDFGGANAAVAKQLLYDTQIRTVFQ